jgi:hypothetical protein
MMKNATRYVTGVLSMLVLGAVACGSPSSDEDLDVAGSFLSSPDDEAIDASDPPTNPDPADDDEPLATSSTQAQAGGQGGAKCAQRSATLSPKGLTFVIHVSKRAEKAQDELRHLRAVARYVRDRDIFMIERTSPVVAQLRETFPCNRFDYIAYPDEMDAALATGEGIDGIAVDWEGTLVEANSQAYSVDRLEKLSRRIRAAGKQPGFVPSWSARFDDDAVMKQANMHYELPQIQGACVNGPARFGAAAHRMLVDFHRAGVPIRNAGFEISLDSFGFADNHVGPARAADCTRAAFGKGARAIYIYGNGQDHLRDYFRALGKMGLRTAR